VQDIHGDYYKQRPSNADLSHKFRSESGSTVSKLDIYAAKNKYERMVDSNQSKRKDPSTVYMNQTNRWNIDNQKQQLVNGHIYGQTMKMDKQKKASLKSSPRSMLPIKTVNKQKSLQANANLHASMTSKKRAECPTSDNQDIKSMVLSAEHQ
jgi:hypothetical protein